MKKLNNLLIASFCTLLVFALFAGCENGYLPSAPEENSTITLKKVEGLTLFRNGHVIAVVDQQNVEGVVTARMGENSDIFEVEFFDENGEIINGDSEEHTLAWENDAQYTTFKSRTEWEFYIYGKKSGETAFQLQLENGRGVDYASPPIPLEVK